MNPMTPKQLTEIKARCEATNSIGWDCFWNILSPAHKYYIKCTFTDFPALIEEVERLQPLANSQPALLAACEAWMKVESESKTSNSCPDYTLRAIYRKEAVGLAEAAIKAAGKE